MTRSIINNLRESYGVKSVVSAQEDMASYLKDWRGRWTGVPLAVLRPETAQHACEMISACAQNDIPMVPQGGQTGLSGGALPDLSGNQVILSAERLKRVRHINSENNTMTVEAGCFLHTVQTIADQHNRIFPLRLASEGSCQIGGNIATNAGGVHVLKYGNMRNLVMGLEVVLPDGRLWSSLKELYKDNSGYDLKNLFIGSEGTLGFITAAVLRLFPRPAGRTVIMCAVEDPKSAVYLLRKLQEFFNTNLVCAEVIVRIALEFVLRHMKGTRDPFPQPHPWYLCCEIEQYDLSSDETIHTLAKVFEDEGCILDAVVSKSQQEEGDLWSLREHISEAQKYEGASIKHDISVPISRIPDFLETAVAAIEAWLPGVRPVPFGHIGDGNIHFNLSQPIGMDPQEFMSLEGQANKIVYDIVDQMGGSISAEHGIGQLKCHELASRASPLHMEMLQAIKKALDPRCIMNPRKVLL